MKRIITLLSVTAGVLLTAQATPAEAQYYPHSNSYNPAAYNVSHRYNSYYANNYLYGSRFYRDNRDYGFRYDNPSTYSTNYNYRSNYLNRSDFRRNTRGDRSRTRVQKTLRSYEPGYDNRRSTRHPFAPYQIQTRCRTEAECRDFHNFTNSYYRGNAGESHYSRSFHRLHVNRNYTKTIDGRHHVDGRYRSSYMPSSYYDRGSTRYY